jgi:hypothetical protein
LDWVRLNLRRSNVAIGVGYPRVKGYAAPRVAEIIQRWDRMPPKSSRTPNFKTGIDSDDRDSLLRR